MPGFEHPAFLLLLPVAVLVAWRHVRRHRPALRFSDTSLLTGLTTGRAKIAHWGGAIFRGAILAALIVALANPRQPDLKTRLPVDGVAIALVLDVSNSMATADYGAGVPVTRLSAAKQAFRLFVAGGTAPDGTTLPGRPNDPVTLITFAAVPQTTCPLTLNHSVLLKVLDDQQPLDGIHAGTNIGDALAEALIRLEAAGDRPKLIVLLSDGEHNKSGETSLLPVQTAQLAARLGIPIHTIDCGGDGSGGTPEESRQRASGRATLDAVASATGGRAFIADSGEELRTVFEGLDALVGHPSPAPLFRRYWDYGPWCGVTAIALLILLSVLEFTYWRSFP